MDRRSVLKQGLAAVTTGLVVSPVAHAQRPVIPAKALLDQREFSLGRFSPLVGSRFGVQLGRGVAVELQLIRVEPALVSGANLPKGFRREAFNLLLEASKDAPALPQGVYTVTHGAFADTELLLVPSGDGRRYVISFNHLIPTGA